MSVLVQTLPVTQSARIAHIMKQFPWYLRGFLFNVCCQFSDCCRFHCVDFVFRFTLFTRRRRMKGIHSRSDANRTGAECLSFYYPSLLHCLNQKRECQVWQGCPRDSAQLAQMGVWILVLLGEYLRTHLKDHTRYDRGPEIHDGPRRVSLPFGEAQLAGCLRVQAARKQLPSGPPCLVPCLLMLGMKECCSKFK